MIFIVEILVGAALGLCTNVAALLLAAGLTVAAAVGHSLLTGAAPNWLAIVLSLLTLNAGYSAFLLAEFSAYAFAKRRTALPSPRRPPLQ